ncbi:hypothetical protein [Candidatus Nanohalococcus occultus]|uniref:hypothetical protein n=1 Tax=Candidatus Nanohalococcus occultus TaxID=2978047 RepID=UPI0039E0D1C2
MELDIFEALSDGFERTFQKNGLMLAGLYFILGLVTTAASQTLAQSNLYDPIGTGTALALPVPIEAAAVIAGVAYLASLVLTIVSIRTFVSEETETIREEFYSRNMLMAALNLIAGGLAFALIVTAGFIALIIPGFFLLTALYYWNVYVTVEDENFIEALESSWNLTEGHRFKLFVLGATVLVGTGVFTSFFGLPSFFGFELAGALLGQIASAITGVFTIATMAQAYNQLRQLE